MSDEKNDFGGANPHGLYLPMSELEQECLIRLAEQDGYAIHIVDWGWITQPITRVGDHRLSFQFTMSFDRPEVPQPCHYFDLELFAKGQKVFSERQHTVYDAKPIMIAAGIQLTLAWDIAIAHIDPKIVKSVLISARGLTSRLQDKDTHEMTLFGNMRMNTEKKKKMVGMRQGEENIREYIKKEIKEKTKGVK